MTSMTTLCYTVRFLILTFLGNAEQNGRWRYSLVPTPMRCP